MNEQIKVNVIRRKGRPCFFLRYRDASGMTVERATEFPAKDRNRGKAERAAGKWQDELRNGQAVSCGKLLWDDFTALYQAEKLSGLAQASQQARYTAFNHFQRTMRPHRMGDITTSVLSQFQKKLRREGMKETTIASHLSELKAAFNWAAWRGVIAKAPQIDMPKRAKGIQRSMRGRPITLEEFERMLATVPKVRKVQPERWTRLLRGLWLGGLRLGEALQLSWDEDAPLCVKLGGKYPKLRLLAESHKAHREQLLPITPDFADFVLAMPVDERRGLVFGIYGRPGKPISTKRASRYLSSIGDKAGVVTNANEVRQKKVKRKVEDENGKTRTETIIVDVPQCASAHDLRRTFGTRWSRKVMPATLKALMRHASIETTMKYYVDRDAGDVAADVWEHAENGPGERGQKTAPDSMRATEADEVTSACAATDSE